MEDRWHVLAGWIQLVVATPVFAVSSSSFIASAGVLNPKFFRGRSFSALGRFPGQVASWVGFVVVGPVSGFSEEPVQGCEPVTLDIRAVPGCPAGSTAKWVQSAVSIRNRTVAKRCFRARSASSLLLPSPASSLERPGPTRFQKSCRCSRHHAGGRPGDRIGSHPSCVAIQPFGRPTIHLHDRGVASTG